MRLLKANTNGGFSLEKFSKATIPPYAILSHTWGNDDEELTFKDLIDGTGSNKKGYRKLEFCSAQATTDAIHYFWVDTCCIDKSNNNELTRAINSMFRYYQNAARCYVYLTDVSTAAGNTQPSHNGWEPQFRGSRWFKRGWTLQELLAPSTVDFYSQEGVWLGDRLSLEGPIHEITCIPVDALQGYCPLSDFSIEDRFSWVATRQTSEEEDMAYCLLGLFNIYLPLIYGEGQSSAMRRLRKEIQESPDMKQLATDLASSQIMPFDRCLRPSGRMSDLARLEQLVNESTSCSDIVRSRCSGSSYMMKRIEKVCRCRSYSTQRSTKTILPCLELVSCVVMQHRPDCPYSKTQHGVQKSDLKFNHVNKIVNATIQASITLRFGAGSWSISPYLAFRGLPRNDSAAKTVFNSSAWQEAATVNDFITIISQMPAQLRILLENGQVSPTETDEYGSSLLHQAFSAIMNAETWYYWRDPDFIEAKHACLRQLCALGLPLNERYYTDGDTILDRLMFGNCIWDNGSGSRLICSLIEIGAEFAEDSEDRGVLLSLLPGAYNPHNAFESAFPHLLMITSMATVSEYAEVCRCSELQISILSKSKSRIASILTRCPSAVSYVNSVGHTPLHVAANWPWGVQTLLDAGADVSAVDNAGLLPLSIACFGECEQTVQALLAAGSPLSAANRGRSVLDDAASTHNVTIFNLVATALAHRRASLRALAESILPARVFTSIIVPEQAIPDAETGQLVDALRLYTTSIDHYEVCCMDDSVYHTHDLLPETADILYRLGFQNVSQKNSDGLNPLQHVVKGSTSGLKMVPWLIAKGADLHETVRNDCGHRSVHFVATGLGQNLHILYNFRTDNLYEAWKGLSTYGVPVIRTILSTQSFRCHDHCKCLCSLDGCSPMTSMLKCFSHFTQPFPKSQETFRQWSKNGSKVADWILQTDDLDPSAKQSSSLSALRLLLFGELELTHTCCRPKYEDIAPAMDSEEAREIVEEETDTIQEFEALYKLADAEWKQSTASFSNFYQTFVDENLYSHRRKVLVDKEYVRAVRDVGVVLNEVSDEDNEAEHQNEEADEEEEETEDEAEASEDELEEEAEDRDGEPDDENTHGTNNTT